MYAAAKLHLDEINKSPYKDIFPHFKEKRLEDAAPRAPPASGYTNVQQQSR
jgi:hypothetical protein